MSNTEIQTYIIGEQGYGVNFDEILFIGCYRKMKFGKGKILPCYFKLYMFKLNLDLTLRLKSLQVKRVHFISYNQPTDRANDRLFFDAVSI